MGYFTVYRKEIIHQYIFVKAETAEQATEIAEGIEEEQAWREGKYTTELLRPERAEPDEMKGCFIETGEGCEMYNETI